MRPSYGPGYFVLGCAYYSMLKLDRALEAFRLGLKKCPNHPKLMFAFNAVMRSTKRTGLTFVDDVREAPGPGAPDAAFQYAHEEAADEAEQKRAATAPPAYRSGGYKAGGGLPPLRGVSP